MMGRIIPIYQIHLKTLQCFLFKQKTREATQMTFNGRLSEKITVKYKMKKKLKAPN